MSAKRELLAEFHIEPNHLGLLREVRAVLGAGDAAGALYRRLLPFAAQPVVDEPALVRLRPVSCCLALLAAATRRWEDAREHLARAFERNVPADRRSPTEPPARVGTEEDVFRCEGEYWTIRYRGAVCRLRDAKGLRHVAFLLAHPDREFDARDLMASSGQGGGRRSQCSLAEGPPHLCIGRPTDAGPILDFKAKATYRNRLQDLREELAEAERFNDIGRASAAREEIDSLTRELSAAGGFGVRNRKFVSDAERARVTVTKRIKDVLQRLRVSHPSLARHLALEIKTGYFCRYRRDPGHPVTWSF